MADYNPNARSLILGLSDFWTQFFKEFDQLDFFYKGAEIELGQVYLDLLSLLLNNSLQDTTLFNKEYFRLITIREDELQFVLGATPNDNRYQYVLTGNEVEVPYLNNKIFEPTQSLEKTIDYFIGDTGVANRLDFKFDPTNAYKERVFGAAIAAVKIRSKLLGPDANLIRVFFNDAGTPLAITRSDFDITITYDGPLNTGQTLARDIVQAINTNELVSGVIAASLLDAVGNGSTPGTVGLVELLKVEFNVLDGYATRQVLRSFGGMLSSGTIKDWVAEGVEKGDILRLISGPGVGQPDELDIDIVRKDRLYIRFGTPVLEASDRNLNFVVLREPANNTSKDEAFNGSGTVVQSAADGSIDASLREFSSPTAAFEAYHEGDIINILSGDNIAFYRIIDVVDAFTVVLAATALIDEFTGVISWELYSVVNAGFTGASITAFTAPVAGESIATTDLFGAFTNSVIGTVLKVEEGGSLFKFDILAHSTSGGFGTLTLANPDALTLGVTGPWGTTSVTPSNVLLFSPPVAWPRKEGVRINARRLIDDTPVQVDVDYEVTVDTGIVRPITVWRTSLNNTITYNYALAVVENTTPLQASLDGSITAGSPNTFSTPLGVFSPDHVGFAIEVSNSGFGVGPTNNGIHVIASVISPTTVELTNDKVVSGTDPNNATLGWSLLRRGITELEGETLVSELSFWAPDILVDRFHLFNTYGYLINKFSRSSESYRNLIRGIFQLFMLGPTLERFESAINTVAGLAVIRDDGELLISYTSGAVDSGTDGFLVSATNSFSSVSITFTVDDIGKEIFIIDGNNDNKLFEIVNIIDPNTVQLTETPLTDGPISWELIFMDPQTITTSERTYTFPRRVPIRPAITDPANFGVKTFRAFEVLTEVFEVTDYVETPRWWEFVQIPPELWEGETPQRRQSTAALFENTIDPGDEGQVGDPGFVVGADDEGVIPPSDFVRDNGAVPDGEIQGDVFYPASNDVFFESPTGAFTNLDRGNFLKLINPGFTPDQFLIDQVISPTRIKIQSFREFDTSVPGLIWEIRSGALAMRHKAAFVVIDKFLKHHLFSVSFDISLLALVSGTLLPDLQQLVFVAKPRYIFLILTPSALFKEIIKVNEEEIEREVRLMLGGGAGELIVANEAPLNVIGHSWKIGQWFRLIENTSSYVTPTASLIDALGAPDPGFTHDVSKFSYDPSQFTSSGEPIQVVGRVRKSVLSGSDGEIDLSTGVARMLSASGLFNFENILAELVITGSGVGNDGSYGIGAVNDASTLTLSGTGFTAETGLDWEIFQTGGFRGLTTQDNINNPVFKDLAQSGVIESTDTNTLIRRTFIAGTASNPLNPRGILELSDYSDDEAFFNGGDKRMEPLEDLPDAFCDVGSGGVVTFPENTIILSKDMEFDIGDWLLGKLFPPYSIYTVTFTVGVNTGKSGFIYKVADARTATLFFVATTPETGAQCVITRTLIPALDTECSNWEYVKRQIVIDNNDIDFTNGPSQDVSNVDYTAYGVREPIDPTVAVFDETQGDTLYSIGMPDPKQEFGKSRSGLETDMREDPIQIKRT